MKLSLFIGAEHRPGEATQRLSEHAEQVRLARQLGFDGVSIGNHLSCGATAWFPPFETLMRLAAEADGMSLGTCMLILPLYQPFHVAEQVALLDAASGGRAILGIAPGWRKHEFEVIGLDYRERIGRYMEAVDLIKRLFTEDKVTFAGKHFRAVGLTLAMRSTRKPRPPLWLGGSVENAVKRAAQIAEPILGDTWVASSHLKSDVIIRQASVFREALAAQGKPIPTDYPVLRNIVVGPDRQTAIRDAGPGIAESYHIFGNWGLFTEVVGDAKTHPEFEELLADRFIIGSPEECAEEITELMRATGCNRLVARIQWVGMAHRHVMRTIELLGGQVAPLVRKAIA
ncbi:MAG: LLM class flavin-dependent oxidoreductase [Hyphomicrobiales bacterium]|nr:LLM class flavin-dependent oxidoreductase [Hyphomicrobiales bacterium]MBV8824034.1 LLM class flavin-dependent oxidoreductase [Hyphomicrobiales bacterium]MBV9428898.1 LLM class flavin-dependent oxidoreductase [Bradyrhizobiaceae bacterium]